MAKILERPHTGPIPLPDSAEMPRKLWTRAQCKALVDAGLLEPEGLELIEGEIVKKMSHGRRHIFACTRIFALLGAIFGFDFIQSQSSLPIDDDNEPEPDAAVLTQTLGNYIETELGPEDVRLLVEVSDSTTRTDQTVKMRLYARVGVPEYWIVNIPERQLEVFRQPTADGYAERFTVAHGGTASPLAAPEARVAVAELLP